ncbi:hypothetical protein, partial [Grimontia hollisae]|uniref:hypothetical protein n=1 Tax=Grimontia hollisae TaxID=673 RepID=UPI001C68FA84
LRVGQGDAVASCSSMSSAALLIMGRRKKIASPDCTKIEMQMPLHIDKQGAFSLALKNALTFRGLKGEIVIQCINLVCM